MPNISQMKTFLYSKYPSKRWKKRIDTMGDSQVIAIWYRLQAKKQEKNVEGEPDIAHQEVQLPLFKDL